MPLFRLAPLPSKEKVNQLRRVDPSDAKAISEIIKDNINNS